MGLLYPGATIVGYNANPPSDDGLLVSSNEVLWQKHLQKLANPVKTLTEQIDTLFRVHTDETVLDIASNVTTTVAQHKRTLNVTGAFTVSLASAATVGAGQVIHVTNSHSADIVVDLANPADTLDGVTNGVFTIFPADAATFLTLPGANGWIIRRGGRNATLGEEVPAIVVKTADESRPFPQAPTVDSEIQFEGEANSVYKLGVLLYGENEAPGLGPDLNYGDIEAPAGSFWMMNGGAGRVGGLPFPFGGSSNAGVGPDDVDVASVQGGVYYDATVVTAGTPGTIGPAWRAANASGTNFIMFKGSWMRYQKVG